MMDHLLPGVDALVELERKTIVDKYGVGYHSYHEGYAVLLEEVEEATEALREVQQHLACAWQDVRDFERLIVDALALIQQLEREKEAMMEYTHGMCRACKHFKVPITEKPCVCCKHNHVLVYSGGEDNWEWRGVEVGAE